MNEALTFFVDVLGCKKAMSFGPIADPQPDGTFMKDALGVDPKTVIKQITLVRCGMGSNIELFSYAQARSTAGANFFTGAWRPGDKSLGF